MNPDEGEYFEASFRELLHFALISQVDKWEKGYRIDTYIRPKRLSSREKEILRHSLKSITHMQELIAGEFGELVI